MLDLDWGALALLRMRIAGEQGDIVEPTVDAHNAMAASSATAPASSPLLHRMSAVKTPPAHGRYVPLFWRVLALNAAVVTTMAVAIAIVLPDPFTHIASDDAAVLAVTLIVTLVANAWLLRNALSPLTHLPTLLRRVDPLQSGERLQVPSTPSEAAELAQAYNDMLDELESERLQSTRRALSAQEGERLRVAQEPSHDDCASARSCAFTAAFPTISHPNHPSASLWSTAWPKRP